MLFANAEGIFLCFIAEKSFFPFIFKHFLGFNDPNRAPNEHFLPFFE